MTPQLTTALDILSDMDTPEDEMFASEAVVSSLIADHGMDIADAHTVLCTAEYLYQHGLTAVKA